MKIYNYNPDNGIYLGEAEADESPLEPGVFLIPAYATETAPPELADKQVAIFNNDAWKALPDYRGETWYDTASQEAVRINTIGQPAATLTQLAPPSAIATWDGSAWVDDLAKAKAAKASEINAACGAQIVAGVTSAALGDAHTYPCKLTDQANLSASVLDSLLPDNVSNASYSTPFWCADASGTWGWAMHTAAQIQQVGRDVKAAILAAQSKNAQLQAEIAAAADLATLDAITW